MLRLLAVMPMVTMGATMEVMKVGNNMDLYVLHRLKYKASNDTIHKKMIEEAERSAIRA